MNQALRERSTEYLTSLEGLRGIGLLLLVANVAPELVGEPESRPLRWIWDRFKGGWLGIDLTFAIGGFLTTRILRLTEATSHGVLEFRIRRALRILPVTIVYCALVTAMAVFTYRFKVLATDAGVLLSTWLFASNVWIGFNGWSVPATSVLWSIALAEQWHLFYPPLAVRLSRARLMQVLVAMMLAAPLARWVTTETLGKTAVFVLLPTRMDAIAAGAIVALLAEEETVRLRRWCSRLLIPSMAFYLLTILTPYREDSSPLWYVVAGYSGVAVAGGVFCGWVITKPSGQASWLASPLLVHFGQICLGFHLSQVISSQIVDLAERRLIHGGLIVTTVLWFAVTWGLAWASYRYMERPFLQMRARYRTTLAGSETGAR